MGAMFFQKGCICIESGFQMYPGVLSSEVGLWEPEEARLGKISV